MSRVHTKLSNLALGVGGLQNYKGPKAFALLGWFAFSLGNDGKKSGGKKLDMEIVSSNICATVSAFVKWASLYLQEECLEVPWPVWSS